MAKDTMNEERKKIYENLMEDISELSEDLQDLLLKILPPIKPKPITPIFINSPN